jgi:hypothetical protein
MDSTVHIVYATTLMRDRMNESTDARKAQRGSFYRSWSRRRVR